MLTCTALAIGLNLTSYHFDRDYPFQEVNPGAYVVCNDWIAGVYRNSFGRTTVHAGKILKWGPIDIEVGIATGYGKKTRRETYSPSNAAYGCTPGHQWCDVTEGTADIIPLIVPSVRWNNARVGLVPPLSSKHRGALTLGMEW